MAQNVTKMRIRNRRKRAELARQVAQYEADKVDSLLAGVERTFERTYVVRRLPSDRQAAKARLFQREYSIKHKRF